MRVVALGLCHHAAICQNSAQQSLPPRQLRRGLTGQLATRGQHFLSENPLCQSVREEDEKKAPEWDFFGRTVSALSSAWLAILANRSVAR